MLPTLTKCSFGPHGYHPIFLSTSEKILSKQLSLDFSSKFFFPLRTLLKEANDLCIICYLISPIILEVSCVGFPKTTLLSLTLSLSFFFFSLECFSFSVYFVSFHFFAQTLNTRKLGPKPTSLLYLPLFWRNNSPFS